MVEENVHKQKVMEVFFFLSPEQVAMKLQFMNRFFMLIDANFNRNELKILFSVLVSVINTLSSFSVGYWFI